MHKSTPRFGPALGWAATALALAACSTSDKQTAPGALGAISPSTPPQTAGGGGGPASPAVATGAPEPGAMPAPAPVPNQPSTPPDAPPNSPPAAGGTQGSAGSPPLPPAPMAPPAVPVTPVAPPAAVGGGAPPVAPTPPAAPQPPAGMKTAKERVIATSDGEIDDECSLVRFLLYANDFDIQGIITSSSQYHWQGFKWAGDNWQEPYLDAYAQVYPNLLLHDKDYPTPEYLRSQSHLGNVASEGDMATATPGSEHIVKVLLDTTDDRPIWLQAWGGTNTIARALKTIEEDHPERMEEVAKKIRLYLIWEQDKTFQDYIKPKWGKFQIPTIISDQFVTFGYWYQEWDFPPEMGEYFAGPWMKQNLLEDHGPLMALYKAHDDGRFRSEGDSPAFLHTIPTGLRSTESPDWGGWGGRYVKIRDNTWLDPVPVDGYTHPAGRWYTSSAWGRMSLRKDSATQEELKAYFKPLWRWVDVMQRDFAARADWTVKPYAKANHAPVVTLAHAVDLSAAPGGVVQLNAQGTMDPDGDELAYSWWQYEEADTFGGSIQLQEATSPSASFVVPAGASAGETIHLVLEVTDKGTPSLTRYQRVVVTVTAP